MEKTLKDKEQSEKAMLRKKVKYINKTDKYSTRTSAYKQGWKDCYEWMTKETF